MPRLSGDVTVCEAWPRDGIQGWPEVFPTEVKHAVISRALAAGFRELDITSLVSPRVAPQFTDAAELLERLSDKPSGVTFRVLVVNEKSIDRLAADPAVAAPVDVCGFPLSASEAHNVANLGMDHRAHKRSIAAMTTRILDLGKSPLIAIATAFGCPLGGPVSEDEVLRLVEWAVELGITQVMLGDTTGMADPAHAYQLTSAVAQRFPKTRLVGHFHDTRGSGIANTLAAIAAGATTVDSSLGGVGGEPSAVNQNHSGPSGNVCTEDLVALLDRMSVRTGIDVDAVLRLGQYVEEISGHALRSQVLRSGVAVPRAAAKRGQHADGQAETKGVGRS